MRVPVEYEDGKVNATIVSSKKEVDSQFLYRKVINDYKNVKATYSENSTEKGERVGGESDRKKMDNEPKAYDLRTPKKEKLPVKTD